MSNPLIESDFSVTYVNNCLVVKLPKRLTLIESSYFQESCSQLIKTNPANQTIILDFSQTHLIDSSGIGALVNIQIFARAYQQKIILQQVSSIIIEVLKRTGLSEFLQLQSATISSPRRYLATHPSINSRLKRLIDIIGAIVGLVTTAVILLPIVIAIKLDSPGPVFFSQIRCGWLGRRFKIWKFRSMCVDAQSMKAQVPNQAEGAFFKNDQDPRITRVGNFLRRTSLDELPQFWNVLRGDMSLVGTRPPTADEVAIYQVPQWQRLNVKPGMTGVWQVSGRSQIRKFEDVIQLDLHYQQNWSLLYDLQLIFQTIMIIFNKNSGAI